MSYILKPKHCPICGKKLSSIVWLVDTRGKPAEKFMPISHPTFRNGFDCYCKHCGWSGNIYPDECEIATPQDLNKTKTKDK